MNAVYVTDGSVEGLLSAVYDSWYNREDNVHNILPGMPAQPDFLVTYKPVKANEAKAAKVFEAIEEKISPEAARSVLLCWCSEREDAGRLILNYLRLGFQQGPIVDEMVTHRFVKPLHDARDAVTWEAHRMLGLARFYRTKQGWYCSVVEPQYYILPLLAEHFADRMPNERWAIFDRGRELSVAYEDGAWAVVPGKLSELAKLHEEEEDYKQMWRRYFDAMAIESRLNPKLQRHFMPKRYWKHLVEDPQGARAEPRYDPANQNMR